MSKRNRTKPVRNSVLDVVIVTGGRFDMLFKCLDALAKESETTSMSVYLVDNNVPVEEWNQASENFASKDDNKFVKFNIHHLKQELGYAEANNIGARLGSSPYIMFLNDDVELQPGAISLVLGTLQAQPTIGIEGIKLLFPPSSTSPVRPAGRVQHVGMALNIRGEPTHPLVGWSADHPKANVSRDVSFVTGACLTIRRKLFDAVGGFDKVYGMGTFEDCDLCFKVKQMGQRVFVNVQAVGHHYVGSTAEKKRVQFPIMQNRMIFQTRWANSGLMEWTDWQFL